MRALTIAATGMTAKEQNLEVIANNVANINTTGFKRSRAEFTDLIYQTERLMGVSTRGRDSTVPEGAPPVKVLFERVTPVMACPAVTLMTRFPDVLASHEVVGMARPTRDSKKIRKRSMFIPLTA